VAEQTSFNLIKEILKRRVIQILGVYLGATIALMEFSGMITERYGFSDRLVDYLLATMLTLLPAVVVLTWRHGAPGKDEWGKTEKVVLPINAIALVGVIGWLATMQPNTNTQVVQATAPTSLNSEVVAQRNITKLGVMFVTPTPTVQQSWLSYAIPYLIATQLGQDPTVVAHSFYNSDYFWEVQRAGFTDGLDVPLSLAKSVAQDADLQYFLKSSLDKVNNQFKLHLSLYETSSTQLIAEQTLLSDSVFQLAEQAVGFITQQAPFNETTNRLLNQIPLTDFITGDIDALKAFIEGKNANLFDNDIQGSINAIKRAVDIDKNFALAYLELAEILISQGQLLESNAYLKKSLALNYKLTEPLRFTIKAAIYATERNITEQNNVYRTWIELYPDDYLPKKRLALLLSFKSNNFDEVIQLYQQSLELNPAQPDIYNRLGKLFEARRELTKAREMYQKLRELRPRSYTPLLSQGNIESQLGNLEEAQRLYKQAALTEVDKVTPVLALADLATRQGDFEKSEQRYREAELIAQAPRQFSLLHGHKVSYYYLRGEYQKAYQELIEFQSAMQSVTQSIDVIFGTFLSKMHIYVDAGKSQEAAELLTSLEDQVDSSMKNFPKIGSLFLNIYQGNVDAANKDLVEVEAIFERFKMENLEYLITFSKARIAALQGDHNKALQLYEKALEDIKKIGAYDVEMHALLVDSILYEKRHLQQYQEGISIAEEFLVQWPYHPSINYQLALLYQLQKQDDKALLALKKAQYVWQFADNNCTECQDTEDLITELKSSAAE